MTKPTESRNIRLLIRDILGLYGVDNLELEIKLTEGVKRFLAEGQAEPIRTREKIVEDLRRGIVRGSANFEIKQSIIDEIKRRVGISPVGKEWEDFVEFAFAEHKQGKTITVFLDWWLSDTWQAEHPPSRPTIWQVKWNLAFSKQNQFIYTGSVGA